MARFRPINFSLGDRGRADRLNRLTRLTAAGGEQPEDASFRTRLREATPELASRILLNAFLESEGDPEVLLEVETPQPLPEMRLLSAGRTALLRSESVVFRQRAQDIPIFGARITVDVDEVDRSLVAINGTIVAAPEGDPIASLSAKSALERLASWANVDATQLSATPPALTWFLKREETDEDGTWHLAFHFRGLQLGPPEGDHDHPVSVFADIPHFCLGQSPRSASVRHDYLVDAHSGDVLFYYRSDPLLDIPVQMEGEDADGTRHTFHGRFVGNRFELFDPLRNIATYDYGHNDIDSVPPVPFPGAAISDSARDLGARFAAAVSAHFNAQQVYDFFIGVLKRKSIDDAGMKIVSAVNVYSSYRNNHPKDWVNAVWWQDKMWYGQRDGVSLARYLDVIAHELTHGITSATSGLIYQGLSGALNESFSDTFGVIIGNWYPGSPQPVSSWNWQIGPGLGKSGGPIRDFANPAATGQPDHFSQYTPLPAFQDAGGVHIYSGIHNKAVFLLLTSLDQSGHLSFPTEEAALLLYLTLTRLTPTATFSDSRRTLESVTRTYYAGNTARIHARLQAIHAAYSAVGL